MRGRHLSLEKQRLKFFQKRFDILGSERERECGGRLYGLLFLRV